MLKKKVEKAKNDSKVAKKEWQQYLEHTKGIERDYMAEIIRSRKIWQMTAMVCLLSTIGAVLYHQFNPVVEKEPFLLRVDNTTGVVDNVSTVKEHEQSYGEVIDSYFLGKYVTAYESYNYYSIQNDYDTTLLMSSQSVTSEYLDIYDSTGGKTGRDAMLGKNGVRKVSIISIVPNIETSTATVRFSVDEKGGTNPGGIKNYVATITYEYIDAKITKDVRLLNPLGFLVTSYRVDEENI